MGDTNLITNPSFENDLTGWTFTGATASRTEDAVPGTGNWVCKLVAVGTAPVRAKYVASGLNVGENYVLSFYSRVADPEANYGMYATTSLVEGPVTSVRGEMVRNRVAFRATTASMTLTIQASAAEVPAGDIIYLDRVQLVENHLEVPYFDGDYPYCSWNGTPGNSTSVFSVLTKLPNYALTTSEIIVANGICLNTYGWSATTRTGRYTLPSVRGDNNVFAGSRGQGFQPFRPIDSGLWSVSMFMLGAYADGLVPAWDNQAALFQKNYTTLINSLYDYQNAIDVYVWQDDGSVRTAKATLVGSPIDPEMSMGGRRAEFSLAFDILSGTFQDHLWSTTSHTWTPPGGTDPPYDLVDTFTLPKLFGGTAEIENAVFSFGNIAAPNPGSLTLPKWRDTTNNVWVKFDDSPSVDVIFADGDIWYVDSGNFLTYINTPDVPYFKYTSHSGHNRFMVINQGNILNNRYPELEISGSYADPMVPVLPVTVTVHAARQHLYA